MIQKPVWRNKLFKQIDVTEKTSTFWRNFHLIFVEMKWKASFKISKLLMFIPPITVTKMFDRNRLRKIPLSSVLSAVAFELLLPSYLVCEREIEMGRECITLRIWERERESLCARACELANNGKRSLSGSDGERESGD